MHRSTTEIIYEFVCDYKDQRGVAPSLREIAKACYLSRTTVQHHLMRLEAWGWIIVLPGVARGIVILERNERRARQPQPAEEIPKQEKRASKKRSPSL
jgi:SOS-response transcriptional repressor LexA